MASRYLIHNEMTATAARASRDLKSFKDGDEVKIVAGTMKNLKARVWYPGPVPGSLTVYVHAWQCSQTVDEDHVIHARR